MDILRVLDAFKQLEQSDQAWIMVTLLDFKNAYQTEFVRHHGAHVRDLITKLEDAGK